MTAKAMLTPPNAKMMVCKVRALPSSGFSEAIASVKDAVSNCRSKAKSTRSEDKGWLKTMLSCGCDTRQQLKSDHSTYTNSSNEQRSFSFNP